MRENRRAVFAQLPDVSLGNLIKVRELWMTDSQDPSDGPDMPPALLWSAFAAVNVVTMWVVVYGQSVTGGGTGGTNFTSGP